MAPPSFLKRRGQFGDEGESKKPKMESGGKKLSFAERQMQKMGWKSGTGLGRNSEGIVTPVEAVMRQSGVGIGHGGSEKSAQQKAEEKRQAERRGEQYEDSEEEEKERKRRQKKIRKAAGFDTSSGTSTPGRPKQKYSLQEMSDLGMQVPAALSILNATGTGDRLITSATLSMGSHVPAESENTKLAKRFAADLDAYAGAFSEVQEERKTVEFQERMLAEELAKLDLEIESSEAILRAAIELQDVRQWDDIIEKLEDFSEQGLHLDASTAVAALHPHFKSAMTSWDPLEESLDTIASDLLKVMTLTKAEPETRDQDRFEKTRRRHATSPFESLLLSYYVPKVRSAILRFDPFADSHSIVSVLASWSKITNGFIQTSLLKQAVPKLTAAIHDFNARKAAKKAKHLDQLSALVLLWAPLLPSVHTDPAGASSGLTVEAKRKFRSILEYWDVSRGVMPGLESWSKLLGRQFDTEMVNRVLPKLSELLSTCEIDPSEPESYAPMFAVMQWKSIFSARTFAELVASRLLSQKIVPVLHSWLTGSPDHGEVKQWLTWLREQFEGLNEIKSMQEAWDAIYTLTNQVLDALKSGEQITDLPLPQTTFDSPSPASPLPAQTREPPSATKEVEETSFRDVVETWCGEEDLLMLPLRKAHETTGNPLFRITASAAGQGGVQVYIKGDVLYAQDRKDKSLWVPMGLDERLVQRASGK